MNITAINQRIRKDKADIKRTANNVYKRLAKYPELQAEFKAIMMKAKRQKGLAALPGVTPWFEKPIASPTAGLGQGFGEEFIFGGLGQNDKPWYESDFVNDLIGFGQKIVTHERIAKDEQRQLELEIAQIEAKNAALDKQKALADALERSGTFTRSVRTTLAENPATIPLLLGLGGALIFLQMQKRR